MNITSAGQSRAQGLIITSQCPTISSTSLPLRQRFPSSRNFVVFPVQLGQRRSPLDSFPFTTYSITDLKTRHICDPNLSQNIDEIWVDSASYYKQKQNPQHEFIIFTITTNDGLRNVIALNRQVHVAGSSGLIGRHKSGTVAQDYFHISHYGDAESLIKHCGRVTPKNRCIHIEQVDFESRAFSFSQLVVLAGAINEWEPSYKLNRNDRWFASLVWDCISEVLEGGIIRHGQYSDKRGQSKGSTIRRQSENLDEVVQKFKDDLVEFEKDRLRDDLDVLSLDSRRGQKAASLTSPRRGVEKVRAATLMVPPTEPHRTHKVTFSSAAPTRISHPRSIESEKDRKSDRTRVSSTCTGNWTIRSASTDPSMSSRMNKDLPSLPPGVSPPHFTRPRSRSVQGLISNPRTAGSNSNDHIRTLRNSLVMPTTRHEREPPVYSPLEQNWVEIGSEGYFGHVPAKAKPDHISAAYDSHRTDGSLRKAQGHLKLHNRRA